MKAKELMIGDWVQNSLGAKGWVKNIRLFPKESDGFGGYYIIDIAYSDDGKSYARLEEKDVEPIPLTAEILEKNGWKSLINGSGDFVLTEPMVGNSATITKSINSWEMRYGVFNGLSICYVHELQHALRLCGIDKEIVL